MTKDFKKKLKENGQNLKWFYDKNISGEIKITYSGFTAQLNGYAPISSDIKSEINKYMSR